jgi:IS30 family transposase
LIEKDWSPQQIVGKNNRGAIVTIVKRKTNFLLMEKLEHGKNATKLTKILYKLLFAYIKHVHTSWEKGSVENANKLIRQYIPKQTNFDTLNYQQIKEIQHQINSRPRKKSGFYSPKEIFYRNLQS